MHKTYFSKMIGAMKRRYLRRWLINMTILGAISYGVITFGITGEIDEFLDHTLSIVLGSFALIIFGFSLSMPKIFLSKKKIQEILESPPNFYELTVVDKSTGEVDKGLDGLLNKLGEDEIRLYTLYHRGARIMGVTWILSDLVLVLGIIVTVIEAREHNLYPFLLLIFLMQLINHPRVSKLETKMEKIKKENRWND